MNEIKKILMTRDNMSRSEADELIAEAKAEFEAGGDPEEIIADYFGLEPDYIFDFLAA